MGENRFANLTFSDFRRMAQDNTLSQYEKIGFPNTYRQGKEPLIWQDILAKLAPLQGTHQTVLDIGPGCSDLPRLMLSHCEAHHHQLLWIDSDEMLDLLPEAPHVTKIRGYYPQCPTLLEAYSEKINAILAYSVLQHVFLEGNTWAFLDASLSLLAPGGMLLLGDIPNVSKRRRFFSSEAGIAFHQAFTGTDTLPDVSFNQLTPQTIDDGVLLGLLTRARNQGFDAYLLPQRPDLPMANRREDLLICRP